MARRLHSRSIIAAQSGFELRYVHKNEIGRFEFGDPEPIIAWRIDVFENSKDEDGAETSVWPVCIDSLCNQRWIIVQPSGRVTDPENREYANIEEAEIGINVI